MSGPVWKVLRVPGPCDSCGENAKELLAVGILYDFAFQADFRYCRTCYERYKGHRDELNPERVNEQKLPSIISRPT